MNWWKYIFIAIILFCFACSQTSGGTSVATQLVEPSVPITLPTNTVIQKDATRTADEQLNPPAGRPMIPSGAESADSQPATGGRKAVFPQTILVFVKEGRFPGSPLQWTFYTTGRVVASTGQEWMLSPEVANALFSLVESAAFQSLDVQYGTPESCQDCNVYSLYIYKEDQVKEIKVYPGTVELPEILKSALDQLKTLVESNP